MTILINRASVDFIKQMVRLHNVVSCFDNVDEEMNTLEDEGLWFECPFCHEVVYQEVTIEVCPFCKKNFL